MTIFSLTGSCASGAALAMIDQFHTFTETRYCCPLTGPLARRAL